MRTLYTKFISGPFFRFVIVGGISALIEYALYFLFKPTFGYLAGNVVAFGTTNIITYILTRRYVFESTNRNKAQEASLYFLCLIGSLLTNQAVLWALVEFGDVDDRIAKVVAIAVTVIWNYFTRKHIVFKNREAVTENSSVKKY